MPEWSIRKRPQKQWIVGCLQTLLEALEGTLLEALEGEWPIRKRPKIQWIVVCLQQVLEGMCCHVLAKAEIEI